MCVFVVRKVPKKKKTLGTQLVWLVSKEREKGVKNKQTNARRLRNNRGNKDQRQILKNEQNEAQSVSAS